MPAVDLRLREQIAHHGEHTEELTVVDHTLGALLSAHTMLILIAVRMKAQIQTPGGAGDEAAEAPSQDVHPSVHMQMIPIA